MAKTLAPTGSRGKAEWIKAAFEAHKDRVDRGGLAVESPLELNRCWCCGRDGSLQQCHIVPRMLGGTAEPENIVPLCGQCHDKAPDVRDPEEMWRWISSQQNFLSGCGAGYLVEDWNLVLELVTKHQPSQMEHETILEWIGALYREHSGYHAGQFCQGVFVKESTRLWIIQQAFDRVVRHRC